MKFLKLNNLAAFLVIVFITLLATTSCSKKEEPKPEPKPEVPEKIYHGDLINPTSEELQTFFDDGYNVIDGNVEFINMIWLNNMQTLSNVREIWVFLKLFKITNYHLCLD